MYTIHGLKVVSFRLLVDYEAKSSLQKKFSATDELEVRCFEATLGRRPGVVMGRSKFVRTFISSIFHKT